MSWAYIDSSVVVASLFGEISAKNHTLIWKKDRKLLSSYLLQAEVASVAVREKIDLNKTFEYISRIGFVRTESLLNQISQIFSQGYLRGADTLHLATALWICNKTKMEFITFDKEQAKLAKRLGFALLNLS